MKRRSQGMRITERLWVDWRSEFTRRHQMAHAFWSYFVSGLLKLSWVPWSRSWLKRTWIHLYLEWCLCSVFWKMTWACDVLYLSVNFVLCPLSLHTEILSVRLFTLERTFSLLFREELPHDVSSCLSALSLILLSILEPIPSNSSYSHSSTDDREMGEKVDNSG